ncbi:MAG: 2-hydroxyhepta-2,4-diene-1,7-dioate isomerase [Bacteroidetes bacterium]|nr:MAG: 2-hydroxyhepta-2,4-diene-1,7-dioate isomerase [Bacteroidota bacterium]
MKIICIGRNYADHARELGNQIPDEPVIFFKPETALIPKGHPFHYPAFTNDLHYETELVLKISKNGKKIEEQFAHKYYNSIGIGIDFTARDVQSELKAKGLPWEKAKGWDFSAPLSREFINIDDFRNAHGIKFGLKKNDKWVQQGNSSDMLFNFDQLIVHISKYFTLKMGDLIFTGTPAGVGSIQLGDKLEAFIEDKMMLSLTVH